MTSCEGATEGDGIDYDIVHLAIDCEILHLE